MRPVPAHVAFAILLMSPSALPAAAPDLSLPLTLTQIAGSSDAQLSLLRNEIYARHGYRFVGSSPRTVFLRGYFTKKRWYHPDTDDSAVVSGRLSQTERRNVDMIVRAERQRQGGPVTIPPAGVPATASLPYSAGRRSVAKVRRPAPIAVAPQRDAAAVSSDDEEAYAGIKAALRRDYPDSYITQKMLFDENVKAYQYMKTVPDDAVKERLQQDYPDSYITQKTLYDDNAKAKASLGE